MSEPVVRSTPTLSTFPVNGARSLETPLRVLIVEDHRCIASSLRRALEGRQGIGRVDVANSVAGAVGAVEAAEPDLVLLDVILGDENGLTLLLKLPRGRPRCLCLTSFVDPDLVAQALDYGACGYLVKEEGLPALHEALLAVAAGRLAFSEEAAQLATAVRPELFSPADAPRLTKRQAEVLQLLSHGKTEAEVAQAVGVSRGAVRTARSGSLAKLGVWKEPTRHCVAVRSSKLHRS